VAFAIGSVLLDLSGAPRPLEDPGEVHGDHEVAIAHPAPAVGLAVLAATLAGTGVPLALVGSKKSRRWIHLAWALILLFIDGLVHWFAASEHIASTPSLAFFLAVGALQIAAVPIALRWQGVLWWAGAVLMPLLFILFAVTRFVPPPFETQPEPVETLGLLSKGIEALFLLGWTLHLGRRGIMTGWRLSRAATLDG
jgi:hypothetical protein